MDGVRPNSMDMRLVVLILFSDEIMYNARLHPEQYSNTFSDAQVKKLHDSMMFVCKTSIDCLADSDKFPEDWLMKHRWGKGKKDGAKLPNGAKITFLKVGGRTSAVVPSVQKKTGAVAGDVDSEDMNGAEGSEEDTKPKKGGKRKGKPVKEEDEADEEEDQDEVPAAKKKKMTTNGTPKKEKLQMVDIKSEESGGRRRSGRASRVNYTED